MTIPSKETIEKAKKGLTARRPGVEAIQGNNGEVDLKSYLDHYGVSIIKEKNNGQGRIYVLKQCPFNPEHNNGEVHTSVAPDGTLGFACKHNSCASYNWHAFREKISGQDSLSQFMAGYTPTNVNSYRSSDSDPSMAEIRRYIELDIAPGQTFRSEDICRGLAVFNSRSGRSRIYKALERMGETGEVKRDRWAKRGYWKRIVKVEPSDIWAEDVTGIDFEINLIMEAHNLIKVKQNQIFTFIGDKGAGKSWAELNVAALNKGRCPILHFRSPELDNLELRERCETLGIKKGDIEFYKLDPGFEDAIPEGPCIALIDYLRIGEDSPTYIDTQLHRILESLKGGVAFVGLQKHPKFDRPTGGQFAIHAPHHNILLDNTQKARSIFKILNSKSGNHLTGVFRTYKIPLDGSMAGQFVPLMDNWKKEGIVFDKPSESKGYQGKKDIKDEKTPPLYKERKKQRKKEQHLDNRHFQQELEL